MPEPIEDMDEARGRTDEYYFGDDLFFTTTEKNGNLLFYVPILSRTAWETFLFYFLMEWRSEVEVN